MGLGRSSQPRVVRTESLRTNRHDTGSTTARSVDELALIRDTVSHYAPVLIAQIRRAGVRGGPAFFFSACHRGKDSRAPSRRDPPQSDAPAPPPATPAARRPRRVIQ